MSRGWLTQPMTNTIRRPLQLEGAFSVEKSGRGRHRVRVLLFTTHDGFVGRSHTHDHRAAYEAAVAERAKAQLIALTNAPKPAPHAQLLHTLDDSTLFREVERRGYAIVSPEEVGIDRNGDALPTRRNSCEEVAS